MKTQVSEQVFRVRYGVEGVKGGDTRLRSARG